MKIKVPCWWAAVIAASGLCPSSARAQGSLTPPGAPAPTMKSLDQIEARTPVDTTHTPGDASAVYSITQPGSYYLTGNITGVSGEYGINIQTNDVTLDLNGFQMVGVTGSLYGIVAGFGQNIVIRNGTLRNWKTGIEAGNGYCELDHVRVYACQSYGFDLADHCALKNCTAVTNGMTGMQIGNRCVVTDCLVSSNQLFGISGGSDCVISGCLATDNNADGIDLGDDFNVSKCSSDRNGGDGFHLLNGGRIGECVANDNNYGIDIDGGYSVVTDSVANSNSQIGIYTSGPANRIENNQTLDNAVYGIDSNLLPTTDIVVRNISSGNGNRATDNYYSAPATTIGPVQTPSTATSPWANF